MSSENVFSEIQKTRDQFNTLLAGYFRAGLRPIITPLGTFNDGTRYSVTDQYRDTKFYLITSQTSADFDQILPTFLNQPASGARRIAVQFPAGSVNAVTLTAGSTATANLAEAGIAYTQETQGITNPGTDKGLAVMLFTQDINGFWQPLGVSGPPIQVAGNQSLALTQDANIDLRTAPQSRIIDGTIRKLVTFAAHLTTNATTTITSATAYITSIVITTDAAGTTSTITIQNKEGTPKKLINAAITTAISTTPTVLALTDPVLMTSGIDIVTAGVAAATVDVWVTYWQ